MNDKKFIIIIGLLYIFLVSFTYMKILGYNYIFIAFNGFLYFSLNDLLLLISFFIIEKCLTDNKKLKNKEMIEWKYYL